MHNRQTLLAISEQLPNVFIIGTGHGQSEDFKNVQAWAKEHAQKINFIYLEKPERHEMTPLLEDEFQNKVRLALRHIASDNDRFSALQLGEKHEGEYELDFIRETSDRFATLLHHHMFLHAKLTVYMHPEFDGRDYYQKKYKHMSDFVGMHDSLQEAFDDAVTYACMPSEVYEQKHAAFYDTNVHFNSSLHSAGVVVKKLASSE